MDNKEYLSEEKYLKVKKTLIIVGCISLLIGIGLFIGSFFVEVPEMGQEGWYEAKNTQMLLRFGAFPFGIMVPMFTFFTAYKREIAGFSAQQSLPVVKESVEKLSPAAGTVAKEITKGIKDGFEDKE